jgi:hypothetical protein
MNGGSRARSTLISAATAVHWHLPSAADTAGTSTCASNGRHLQTAAEETREKVAGRRLVIYVSAQLLVLSAHLFLEVGRIAIALIIYQFKFCSLIKEEESW